MPQYKHQLNQYHRDNLKTNPARELHRFLEIETPLTIWMPRMLEYGFTQNSDYQRINKNVQIPNGGTKQVLEDYALTLDTAKEISMIQRSEKGKQARQYFIACEKKLQEIAPRTHLEVLDAERALLIASEKANALLLDANIRIEADKPKVVFADSFIGRLYSLVKT
jgi:anti-repressor protein